MKHIIYDAENATEFDFDDEKINLNRVLPNKIIVIADLGLWNGRKSGYKMIGNNLNDILYTACGEPCFYYDGKNVVCDDSHHDGTNHYTFRLVREGVNIENLCEKIYNGKHTSRDITRYTVSLKKFVKEIYGW